MKYSFVFVLLMVSFYATSDNFHKGENLITPYELDEDKWEVLKRVKGSFKSMMWRSKAKGMADTYIVNIQGGNNSSLTEVKRIQDAPGEKACENFESIELAMLPNQYYDSTVWRTICTNGPNFKAQILHAAIKGKDSIYHVQKIWRGEVADNEMKKWVSAFNKIYVCDTRDKNKACPKDYEKVSNF